MRYKYKDKEAAMQTDNLSIARQILAEPERYRGLMREWAMMIVKQSEDVTEN